MTYLRVLHALQRAPSIATVLDLQELRIYPYGLEFKDDAAEGLARQRGAEEVDNNFLTLANARALVKLVRKHMSTAVRLSLASEDSCNVDLDSIRTNQNCSLSSWMYHQCSP